MGQSWSVSIGNPNVGMGGMGGIGGMGGMGLGPGMGAMVDDLLAGQRLAQGEGLRSADGRFTLEMQCDGNLVLYRATPFRTPIWSSNTYRMGNMGGPFYLDMQADGNLVVYQFGHIPIWASNTCMSMSPHRPVVARLQSDGNLMLYDSFGQPRWCTGTSGF